MTPIFRLALVAAVLCACSTVPAPRWDAEHVTRKGFPRASAVVLSDHARLVFQSTDGPASGYRIERHQRIKILTPAGRSEARRIIPLDAFTDIERLWARSIGPGADGEVTPLDVRDVTTRTLAGTRGILYSDARVAMFDVPGADVGDVVEVFYELRSTRGFAIDNWVFDGELPVVQSRFDVQVPPGWEMRWSYSKAGALDVLDPRRIATEPDAPVVLRWELKDLPAISTERLGLSARFMARRLRLTVAKAPRDNDEGVFASWDALATWYRTLIKGLSNLPRDPTVADLVATRRARPMFEYVRNVIRYVAIHEGIGAVKPHDARQVHRVRYGDCKDKATLLTTMLNAAGIRAFPALMSTRGHGVFDPKLPTLSAFDHMVVAIADPNAPGGNGWLFVDPTARHPFGALPFGDADRPVLIVGDKVTLTRTPKPRPEQARVTYRWDIHDAAGERLALRIRAYGSASVYWRAQARSFVGRKALKRAVARLAGPSARVEALTITEEQHSKASTTAEVFELKASLRVPGLVERLPGGGGLVGFGQLLEGFGEVRVPVERRSPVVLGQPEIVEETVVLPHGATLPVGTRMRELSTPVGRYDAKVGRTQDGRVTFERKVTWLVDVAPAEQLTHVRTLAGRIGRDVRLGGLLPAAVPPRPKAPAIPSGPFKGPMPSAGGVQ